MMEFNKLDKVWVIQGGKEEGACPAIVIGVEHGMYVTLKFTKGIITRYLSNPKWVIRRTVSISDRLFEFRRKLMSIDGIQFELPKRISNG